VKTGIESGLDIDAFAPRLSFFWASGMNHFEEIAKMRAARLIWADCMKKLGAKNPKSLMLRTHTQTSGWSLTAQDPWNNVARTTLEAMSAVFGGTQSLHTNSMDEAIALPTEASARVARNTQLFLQNEAGLCNAVDPWHGSRMMEDLTRQMVEKADALIAEIDEAGGMSSAIEQGIPKLRIEAAAAKKQARIDRGQDRLIGVNLFVLEEEEELATLEIDQSAVRLDQERRLQHVKANRSTQKANEALQALTRGAKEDSNLLDLAVKAARSRATLGEISLALEEVYGRFKPKTQKVSGIFSRAMEGQEAYQAVVKRAESFAAKVGRQPRIWLRKWARMGMTEAPRWSLLHSLIWDSMLI
jgi:methylmalonyl-CoA mutase